MRFFIRHFLKFCYLYNRSKENDALKTKKQEEFIMLKKCEVCKGSGMKPCIRCGATGSFKKPGDCPICQGEGKVECNHCNKTGYYEE